MKYYRRAGFYTRPGRRIPRKVKKRLRGRDYHTYSRPLAKIRYKDWLDSKRTDLYP